MIVELEKGDVQFSVLPPPFDRIAEARGIHKLYALPDLGIQWSKRRVGVESPFSPVIACGRARRARAGRRDEVLFQ